MPPLPRHQTLYPRFFKRLLDIAGALVLLSLLAPFLLLLALIIAVNSRGCPIFTQWRIGRGCVPFRIIKFKTMNDRTGADGQLLPDSERTTPSVPCCAAPPWTNCRNSSTSLSET